MTNPTSLNKLFNTLNINAFKIDKNFKLNFFNIEGDDEYLRLIYEIDWQVQSHFWTHNSISFKFPSGSSITSMTFELRDIEKLYFKEIEAKILEYFSHHSTFLKYGITHNSGYLFMKNDSKIL